MYPIIREERGNGPVIEQQTCGELEYLTFPQLTGTGMVKHLFTTRTGGVSEGIFSTLNLSFTRGDDPRYVLENFERVGRVLGVLPENMVTSRQTHTTNIRLVTNKDRGLGVTREQEEAEIDGLITKEPGIALVTSFADCVPLYFVDPVHRAIGLAHSGWRGTANRMGECMIRQMETHFGTRPEDLYSAIGPSICQSCYEVSEDVAEVFIPMHAEAQNCIEELCKKGIYKNERPQIIKPGVKPGKYQLDLWLANAVILMQAGVLPERLSITDICTCHNPEYLFSHRASKGMRGTLCAFLMLKES